MITNPRHPYSPTFLKSQNVNNHQQGRHVVQPLRCQHIPLRLWKNNIFFFKPLSTANKLEEKDEPGDDFCWKKRKSRRTIAKPVEN